MEGCCCLRVWEGGCVAEYEVKALEGASAQHLKGPRAEADLASRLMNCDETLSWCPVCKPYLMVNHFVCKGL